MPATAGLKSLQAYVDSSSPAATGCARAAGLFLEAHEMIRQGNAWEAAARRLSEKYAPKAGDERQKQELARLVIGVSTAAAGLQDLAIENAGLAYLEMCRQKALGLEPAERREKLLATRLAAARKCELRIPPGTRQKDCVVSAFEPPKKSRRK